MRLFITNDGKCFNAECDADLVERLRKDSAIPALDNEQFMKEASDRIKQMLGKTVSHVSPAEFIEGLINAGLLVRVKENKDE